ncbi:MAG TPA: ribosomal L7Ae/L30e/S12e/Gadd45 family protein [Bacillota bacterium]|jgi:ribosomal protein L7Ae-like RNA K-turn-binding protein|nr:ribosomal L7Ae/L30e/S12e/Gadd45 family protein [Bacillota bacterium]HOL09369.1 ribosomal L7Ae/L30e/S12e/Gadd45 family protein [Bacillota bacterium]HPO97082.1 ribosomal L7Ae/L30e/S12e/Gadd45 family protein [Bacillota bacterium]
MNKLATLLGFASKSGQLVLGSASVESAIKKRQVRLVICATDLSPKTLKNFQYLCEVSKIRFICYGLRVELGQWVGAPERGVIGVISNQFATAIVQLFNDRGDYNK